MQRYLKLSALAVAGVMLGSAALRAQSGNARQTSAPPTQNSSKVPDLSGDWAPPILVRLGGLTGGSDAGGAANLGGGGPARRGKDDGIPYQPWALQKMMSEISPTGNEASFVAATDPNTKYCEPVGVMRIYAWPAKTRFVQTPVAVYIFYEYGMNFRVVRLNSKHPDDPDPQWWGDSIGWYENGDTLIIDTVGFNDKTWLDQAARPHTEMLHFVERYKRVDANNLQLDETVDDPGAYTKPWDVHLNFILSTTGFLRDQWVCSTRENQQFIENVGNPADAHSSGK